MLERQARYRAKRLDLEVEIERLKERVAALEKQVVQLEARPKSRIGTS